MHYFPIEIQMREIETKLRTVITQKRMRGHRIIEKTAIGGPPLSTYIFSSTGSARTDTPLTTSTVLFALSFRPVCYRICDTMFVLFPDRGQSLYIYLGQLDLIGHHTLL